MESMNKEQRRQMEKDCMELIIRKMSGELDSKQYCDALIAFHEKYPMPGHNPPLTTFQLKNYKRLNEIHTDRDTGIKYWDHIQPWNFDEAAQMYYWHSRPDYAKEKEQPDLKSRAAGDYQEEVPF